MFFLKTGKTNPFDISLPYIVIQQQILNTLTIRTIRTIRARSNIDGGPAVGAKQ